MPSDSYPLTSKVQELIAAIQNPLAGAMAGLENVIPISQGDPDLPTPPHIIQAAKQALDQGHTHYTPVRGLLELRQAIAKKLAQDNSFDMDPAKEIIVTSGAQEAIFALVQALLGPEDELLLPDPCYTAYNLAATISGGRAVSVRISFLSPVRQLEKAMTRFKEVWDKCR